MRIADLGEVSPENWNDPAYADILTDSLWQFDRRAEHSVHEHGRGYHGNFVPQIPNQLLRRFTKPGDWVCDPFLGMGTTLIEAAHLGRNGFGIELSETVAGTARALTLAAQANAAHPTSQIIANGDCRNPALWERIAQDPDVPAEIDLLLLHPPYWDIVKFSEDDPRDLSQATDFGLYFSMLEQAFVNLLPWLKPEHYGALVIGDVYRDSEWVTLGDLAWQLLAQHGMKLKGKIVKNLGETRAKGQNNNLWRRRALAGGFYVFRHEYVYVWQKPKFGRIWRLDPAWERPVSCGGCAGWTGPGARRQRSGGFNANTH